MAPPSDKHPEGMITIEGAKFEGGYNKTQESQVFQTQWTYPFMQNSKWKYTQL